VIFAFRSESSVMVKVMGRAPASFSDERRVVLLVSFIKGINVPSELSVMSCLRLLISSVDSADEMLVVLRVSESFILVVGSGFQSGVFGLSDKMAEAAFFCSSAVLSFAKSMIRS